MLRSCHTTASLSNVHPLHGGAEAGGAVQCENSPLQLAGPIRTAVAPRQTAQKRFHRLRGLYAQNRFDGAGHPQIRDIAGALGIDPLIGSGDMGVGAPQGTDPAVQIVAQRQFFTGGLRMEIHQGKIRSALLQQPVRQSKGIFGVPLECAAADEVHHAEPPGH